MAPRNVRFQGALAAVIKTFARSTTPVDVEFGDVFGHETWIPEEPIIVARIAGAPKIPPLRFFRISPKRNAYLHVELPSYQVNDEAETATWGLNKSGQAKALIEHWLSTGKIDVDAVRRAREAGE